MPTSDRTNLLDLPITDLAAALGDDADTPFRSRQIAEWIHDRRAGSFAEMTNLPRELRERLDERFSIAKPAITQRTEPAEDGSVKYLFELSDGSMIEAVYIPMRDRATICVSSQAGCAVGCTFCVTGFFGAGRNLRPSEILGQIHDVQQDRELSDDRTNIVFMGMGEPLMNMRSLSIVLESLERRISPRRITVSTAGVIPGIRELATFARRPNLAVSLNAPNEARRRLIMPLTEKYPLRELMKTLREFPLERGRRITLEYVLLAGWNDRDDDARLISRLVRGLPAKINLIPFNPDPRLPDWMRRPEDSSIDRFARMLTDEGVAVTVRRSKGLEIAAACGQLKGRSEPRPQPDRGTTNRSR